MQSLNYQDITLKARITNLEELERKIVELGATFAGTDLQTDHYFKTHKGKLKYRAETIENLITHYERQELNGIENTTVYRYDLNPAEAEIKILFLEEPIAVIRKEKKIYFLDAAKIHLDKTEKGDQFIEIEVIDRNNKWTIDHLKKRCFELQQNLGISDNDLLPTGYFQTYVP